MIYKDIVLMDYKIDITSNKLTAFRGDFTIKFDYLPFFGTTSSDLIAFI